MWLYAHARVSVPACPASAVCALRALFRVTLWGHFATERE